MIKSLKMPQNQGKPAFTRSFSYMIKILFICHGNICRSPMAEFILRDMVRAKGIANDFHIESAATSTEEIGNPVHHGTRRSFSAWNFQRGNFLQAGPSMRKRDYAKFDYIIRHGRNEPAQYHAHPSFRSGKQSPSSPGLHRSSRGHRRSMVHRQL